MDRLQSQHTERQTDFVAMKMDKYGIDVAALSLGPHCAYFSHANIEITSSKGVHCTR